MDVNKHPGARQNKCPDLNTALDSDLLAQSGHCDYFEAIKNNNNKQTTKQGKVTGPWISL